jgi:hypothetical protein
MLLLNLYSLRLCLEYSTEGSERGYLYSSIIPFYELIVRFRLSFQLSDNSMDPIRHQLIFPRSLC